MVATNFLHRVGTSTPHGIKTPIPRSKEIEDRMKAKLRRRVLPVTVVVLLITGGLMMAQSGISRQVATQDSQGDVEAVRRGGLREAARIKGRYVGSNGSGSWLMYDLESLTKKSLAVVIGTPIASVTQLSDNGEMVLTEYDVKVKEVFKGHPYPDQVIKVRVPGGKITFENGTSAEILTDVEPMEERKNYVLFLTVPKANSAAFSLIGEGQGLFGLTAEESVVKPHGPSVGLVQKHKNQRIDKFLEEIRNAVRKYPDISTCCK